MNDHAPAFVADHGRGFDTAARLPVAVRRSAEAAYERRRLARRADRAEMLVVAGRQPAAGHAAREVVVHMRRAEIETRIAAIARDDEPSCDLTPHVFHLKSTAAQTAIGLFTYYSA